MRWAADLYKGEQNADEVITAWAMAIRWVGRRGRCLAAFLAGDRSSFTTGTEHRASAADYWLPCPSSCRRNG